MAIDYSPIVLDSINPENFPKVELYVKQLNLYTLYKQHDIQLTKVNLERLRKNDVDFVFVQLKDVEEVHSNIEGNLNNLFENQELSRSSKNLIFCHIVISCIRDVFKNPGLAVLFHKCRSMIKQLELEIKDRFELMSLFSKLENYDTYLIKHTAKVALLSMFLFQKIYGDNHQELIDIAVGAMLHDIGMLNVSSKIIEKNDALSEDEYLRVKRHPRQGYDKLLAMGISDAVPLEIMLSHHERYDGSGYPRGLHGEKISRESMIVAISDIFCALITESPYRKASTTQEAINTMTMERQVFNPEAFKKFIELITASAN